MRLVKVTQGRSTGRIRTHVLLGIKGPRWREACTEKSYLIPEFPSQTVVPERGEDKVFSSGGSKSGMGESVNEFCKQPESKYFQL